MASFKLSRRSAWGAACVMFFSASPFAHAQQQTQQQTPQQTQGFAVERFYPSAPGAGWFVMDDLNIDGGLGGAVSLTTGYSRNPLEIANPGASQPLALVANEAFADVGAAMTYRRFRVYFNLPVPLVVNGNSGTIGQYRLTGPAVNIGQNPDTISDSRIGFDMRLFGKPKSALRLGASAQLIVPSGNRDDYVTDGRYRAMFRFLAAGDIGRFLYAGQLGVHVRPAEDLLPPGSPDGNEILFGAAVGRRLSVGGNWTAIVGPEFFGETAVHSSPLQSNGGRTGFEGLFTTRLEPVGDKSHLRFRLGIGHGIIQEFGAPEWRILVGVELIGRRTAH